MIVWDMIKGRLFRPSISDDQVLGGKECDSAKTRLDRCWILSDRIVHGGNDEHSHNDRGVACERKKNDTANWGMGRSLTHRPTVMVKFNCNEYDKRHVPLEEGCDALVDALNHLFTCDTAGWSDHGSNLVYMYYHSKSDKHIEAARKAEQMMHV
jgi:hypothetical protein